MSDRFISSMYIQKLGHKIPEIRERAIFNIISKLDRGFVYDNDLARSKEILTKLFEWFSFDRCTNQDVVLNLVKRIFQTESGFVLVNHYGVNVLSKELRQIRSNVEPKYYKLVDELLEIVKQNRDASEVPPFEPDIPLSYRTGQTDFSPQSNTVGVTATTIEGFIQHNSSAGQQSGKSHVKGSTETIDELTLNKFDVHLPNYTLNWQNLIAADRHVLESVEESLQNPLQISAVLHSCEFFTDVMLHDFPAELFLQRPGIVLNFETLLVSSVSSRITYAILNCLYQLTNSLKTRIHYYHDPCMHNLKQYITLENSSPTSCSNPPNTERSIAEPSESDSEDIALLRTQQLSLPDYCFSILKTIFNFLPNRTEEFVPTKVPKRKGQASITMAFALMDGIIKLFNLCFTRDMWNYDDDPVVTDILNKFNAVLLKYGDILEHCRLEVASSDSDITNRMIHLHLLVNCANLLDGLIPLSSADRILPNSLKNALASSLLDSAFARLYPAIHEMLLQFVQEFGGHLEMEYLTKYQEIQLVCNSMSSLMKFFKKPPSVSDTLDFAKEAIVSLEFHKNLDFVKTFVEVCANKLPMHMKRTSYFDKAKDVTLALLAHSDDEIKQEMYQLCQKRVIAAIGPKLNTSRVGAPGSQVLFLLNFDVLNEITLHGVTSENIQIQSYATDILIHILKCKILVSDDIWNQVVEVLISITPALVCHAGKSTTLGKTIVSIFDPDRAQSLMLPPSEVLKGNLLLLFVDHPLVREEAVSRLCWILASQSNSRDLLPRLNNLQDKAFSNACNIKFKIDLNKIKPNQHYYQPSSLYQVLELLNTNNVEPVIRRSALTQISVMIEDAILHPTFLQQGGLKVVLNVMKSALLENDYRDYPDSIIPVISVLKNVCFDNASVRHELKNNHELYIWILRGLFLFITEDRVKQDASSLFCLLLFNDYCLGTSIKGDFSLPHLIISKLNLPFVCNEHWKISKNMPQSLVPVLMSDKWCSSSLQIHWNSEWFGGFQELLKWGELKDSIEFNEKLRLTNTELLAIKNSSLKFCIEKYLNNVQNGTSHKDVIESVNTLLSYINLYSILMNELEITRAALLSFPWENTFLRFLTAPPANEEDTLLLVTILKFLSVLVKLYKNSEDCWIISILKDNKHCLPNLLQTETLPEVEAKLLNCNLLNLIAISVCQEQHYLDFHSDIKNSVKTSSDSSWSYIIGIIIENLKYNETQHFYNLAYLDALLSCLVHLTATLGWSESKPGHSPKLSLSRLVKDLCELITAFHCGKGSSASTSLMGLSITRHTLLILNHVLMEMQVFNVKGWEMCFLNDDNILSSFYSLWTSRDVVLRAAVLQLLAGLAVSQRLAIELVQGVQSKKGIWEIAMSALLDYEEANIVKENAATLLGNLSSHTMPTSSDNLMIVVNVAPISVKSSNNAVEALLHFLEGCNFYNELGVMLALLYTDSELHVDVITLEKHIEQNVASNRNECSFAYTKNLLQELTTRSSTSRSTANDITLVTTPGVIKALAVFVYNLLALAIEDITTILQEYGLIKKFFKALCVPAVEINSTKELTAYCEILEMNTAVCAMLCKAVAHSKVCLGTVLHTRDCLHLMLSLLNPSIYHTFLPQLIYLRNRLWTEVFTLIGALLDHGINETDDSSASHNIFAANEAFNIITSALNESGHQPFLLTLCEAFTMHSSSDLQQSALTSLTSLLRLESDKSVESQTSSSLSMQMMLDSIRTPRTHSTINSDLRNMKPANEQINEVNKSDSYRMNLLQKVYFGRDNDFKNTEKSTPNEDRIELILEENDTLMAGAELCKILLHLYDVTCLKLGKNDSFVSKKRSAVISTLTTVLCVSHEAKRYALQHGLLVKIMQQLKEFYIKLSLESVECLKRITDKRRVCPVLKEVGNLIGLVTNFLLGSEKVKNSASTLGLADLIHKLWVWFNMQKSLLNDALKMLCTYTTDCTAACQSLTLTSSVAGSGPRKVPSNVSLLHAVCTVVLKEMELVCRTHDLGILQLCFHLLHNTCASAECRVIIVKSNLLQGLSRLHPAITKRQKPWENVEMVWLQFLHTLTSHPEGQAAIAKAPDVLELVITLASSIRISNRQAAMIVLRNIAFHQPNRPRLLTCEDFLGNLDSKLSHGSTEEKVIVTSIIWTLLTNNQKAKLIFKCAGLDVKLQEALKQFHLTAHDIEPQDLEMMHYVLNLLTDGAERMR